MTPGALTDPNVEWDAELAGIPDLVSSSYAATVNVINTHYNTNYLASLFKNATRCKDVVQHASKLIAVSGVVF